MGKELSVAEQRELMKQCLKYAVTGQVGVFLNETVFHGDEIISARDIDTRITDKCHPIIRFSKEYVFLDLEFSDGMADLKSVEYLFNKFLDKNTQTMLDGSEREYFYNVSIAGTEEADTYVIDLVNPCFMGRRGEDILQFSFPMDNMTFSKSTANLKEIDKAIEYEERMEADYWEGYREEEVEAGIEPVFETAETADMSNERNEIEC